MNKKVENQVHFSLWSENLSIGFNSVHECYFIENGIDYKMKPYFNRGTLRFKYKDGKTISYKTIKSSITEKNKTIKLQPLPF